VAGKRVASILTEFPFFTIFLYLAQGFDRFFHTYTWGQPLSSSTPHVVVWCLPPHVRFSPFVDSTLPTPTCCSTVQNFPNDFNSFLKTLRWFIQHYLSFPAFYQIGKFRCRKILFLFRRLALRVGVSFGLYPPEPIHLFRPTFFVKPTPPTPNTLCFVWPPVHFMSPSKGLNMSTAEDASAAHFPPPFLPNGPFS